MKYKKNEAKIEHTVIKILLCLLVSSVAFGTSAFVSSCVDTTAAKNAATNAATNATKMEDPAKIEDVYYECLVPGLPIYPGKRVGGLYNKIVKPADHDVDFVKYYQTQIVKWMTYLSIGSVFLIIAAFVLAYFKVPFWKDVLLLAGLLLFVSIMMVFFIAYVKWIALTGFLGIGGYVGYVFWRKNKDEQIQKELVTTGEILKTVPQWTEKEKELVKKIQSGITMEKVKKIREQIKDSIPKITK